MAFKKQDIPAPAGYDSRFISGNMYLGDLNITDNNAEGPYEYAEPVESNHRNFFGSNCPPVTIPSDPMWDVKQFWK